MLHLADLSDAFKLACSVGLAYRYLISFELCQRQKMKDSMWLG